MTRNIEARLMMIIEECERLLEGYEADDIDIKGTLEHIKDLAEGRVDGG